MAFYESHAKHAASVFEAAPGNTVKAVFRRGNPAARTEADAAARTATGQQIGPSM